ncbi:hypothetical protein LTR84_003144 [Exophiala bonariae]|uniref:C2H2-domain containing protein second zinc finger domain-containing protein n=1 Tax=Exophiala bonariae TaxID=1690606 RepID=A0AAV9NBY5_9EURO|nr:hypothetical protein LTR84_003144 [Exophiala bonariae]
MPWTIWPALVVLWGVCWMFYDGFNSEWTFSNAISADYVTAILSDGHDFVVSSQDNSFQPGSSNFAPWAWMGDDLDMRAILDHAQRQNFDASDSSIDVTVPTTQIFLPVSSVVAKNALILPIMGREVDPLAIEAPVRSPFEDKIKLTEFGSRATAETAVLSRPDASNAAGLSLEEENIPPRNSKHGQIEKYYCPYEDCKRSKPGSGFKRKDHLDQHLDGPHKRKLAPKAREVSAGDSEVHDRVFVAETTMQSKKRKRESEIVRGQCDIEDLSSELAEERQLRKRVEIENQRLQARVEECEGRIRKSEERIDR